MFSNKIKGCIFGYAIGDALGLGTEFMTRPEIERRYPDGLTNYSQIIRDAHRSQWRPGDYTNDTDVLLELAESIIEVNGIDHLHFAKRLKAWYESCATLDIGSHIRWVLANPDFASDPLRVSREAFTKSNRLEASNEALGRALIIGMWPGYTEQQMAQICQVTHWHSRCVAAAVIIAAMANELLWHRREADFDRLWGICQRIDESALPYLEAAKEGSLDDLELDDEESFWYVRKAMASALWILWHHTDPEEALSHIIAHGGDADTNASLSLGLLGLKFGFSKLPSHLIQNLCNAERLENVASRLVITLQDADNTKDTDE